VFPAKGEYLEFIMPPARTRLLTIVSAVFLCFVSPAPADEVFWGCIFKPAALSAGPLSCHQTMACDRKHLSCRLGDRPLFDAHAFADRLAVSDKGQYIVGLSNRGMVPLYWLRNFGGKELGLVPVSAIHFCRRSVTNVREWFDEKNPDVTFQFDGDKLSNVTVSGCDGRAVLFRTGE
jgi:hypothetical protein